MTLRHSRFCGLVGLLVCALMAACASSEAAERGPAASPEPKVLNNFVTELLQISPGTDVRPEGYHFLNPREGWVFFRSTANVAEGNGAVICLGIPSPENAILRHGPQTAPTLEWMRYLPAGEQTIFAVLKGPGTSLSSLTVRAIPEIQYSDFPFTSAIREYGPYDFDYLKRVGMLDNANVFIGRTGIPDGAISDTTHLPIRAKGYDDLTALGKRILERRMMFHGRLPRPDAVTQVHQYWAITPGLGSRVFDGLIIDEFSGSLAEHFPVYIDAIRRILDKDDKILFYLYLTGGAQDLVRPFMDEPRVRFVREIYMGEVPTEEGALNNLASGLKRNLFEYADMAPGFQGRILIALGMLCAPPESLNRDPAVSFKAHLDIQLMILATDPGFRGLYGVQEYNAAYVDEEYLRWSGKLFRHYCIEGKTDRLSKDPYKLDHVRNPDFEQGLEGWSVSPAEAGSVDVKKLERYGDLQGIIRWDGRGYTFFWTKRNAEKPNVISQEIRNLQPGRTYSMKMYVGDYLDPSRDAKHAISVRIDGARLVPEKSFQTTFQGLNPLGKINFYKRFGDQRAYFNLVRLVFRAKAETATLSISDWLSPNEPGGPVGQEHTYNFVEIEPYLMEDDAGN